MSKYFWNHLYEYKRIRVRIGFNDKFICKTAENIGWQIHAIKVLYPGPKERKVRSDTRRAIDRFRSPDKIYCRWEKAIIVLRRKIMREKPLKMLKT
jgi:hypothetical protein